MNVQLTPEDGILPHKGESGVWPRCQNCQNLARGGTSPLLLRQDPL